MDHFARSLPLDSAAQEVLVKVPLLRRSLRLEPAQPQGVHHMADRREGRLESLGDAAERGVLIEVPADQAFPTDRCQPDNLCQPDIGVARHGA